jgi:CRISPR-associated exonuclease Cas4
MLNIDIEQGAIFYGKTKNRLNVIFDKSLRDETEELSKNFHNLIESNITPKPQYSSKCDNCSFKEICLPEIFSKKKTVKQYLSDVVAEQE